MHRNDFEHLTLNGGQKAIIVSEGTLRPEDLIPAFAEALRERRGEIVRAAGRSLTPRQAVLVKWIDQVLEVIYPWLNDPEYFRVAMACWHLEDLTDLLADLLGEAAPEGYYFGAHEDDGACFGFWPIDDNLAGV